MKRHSSAEKLLIEEIMQTSMKVQGAIRGLSIGALIKLIRLQLGMSQAALAKRAEIPQSTVSRIEQEKKDIQLSTLQKVLKALSCDLIILPLLKQPIDQLRHEQAKKVAKQHIRYLSGTMSLEDQRPDDAFMSELLEQEERRLLQEPRAKLWDE